MTLLKVGATVWTVAFTSEVTLISLLVIMPRLGKLGKTISEALTRAPWLDLIILMILPIPWLIGSLVAGWLGLAATLVAQITAMQLWIFFHELTHRSAKGGSRIARFLNKEIGWWRNHLGLWISTLALPMFLMIRLAETLTYPFFVWIVGFPKYNHGDWVNVSRQKFDGLVGHDLI